MNLQFKFQPDASTDERNQVLSKLAEDGAEVERLFPDEADGDLAALYTASVDDSRFATLLRRLKRSRKVAYAEPAAERAIYLPQEMAARLSPRRR